MPPPLYIRSYLYILQTLSVQARLFKSLKLWSFYVDLEESIGTVETTKAVYDKILELRIANAQIIVNYASFLEENHYFEESFKAYERGVELFTFPISFEIWNIYLTKFVKRYVRTVSNSSLQGPDVLAGWYEAGAGPRPIRAGSREMPSQTFQTPVPDVCPTRRRLWSSQAVDIHSGPRHQSGSRRRQV